MTSLGTTQYPRTFPAPGPLAVSVQLAAGQVAVTASDVTEAAVTLSPADAGDQSALEVIAKSRVELRGDALRIEVPRGRFGGFRRTPAILVEVTVPTGSSLATETGSADVLVTGAIGALDAQSGSGDLSVTSCGEARVRSGSGDVQLGKVGSASAKSGSGDITVGHATDDLDLQAASGDIRIGKVAGDARLSTSSGDAEIGVTAGRVAVKTASGDVAVKSATAGELVASTASGDVAVGVPEGTAARLECSSISGRVTSQLEASDAPGDDERRVVVAARTASGSITVHRAS